MTNYTKARAECKEEGLLFSTVHFRFLSVCSNQVKHRLLQMFACATNKLQPVLSVSDGHWRVDQNTRPFTADSNSSEMSQQEEGRFSGRLTQHQKKALKPQTSRNQISSKLGSREVKSQRQSGTEWVKGTVMFVLRGLMGGNGEVKLVR